MKRIALAIFLLGPLAFGQSSTPPLSTDHTVTSVSGWKAPAGSVNCTAYGGTATSNCVNGYLVTIIQPAGSPGTNPTITNCASGATANCLAPGALNFTYTPGGALYCGSWNYSVETLWLDNTGTQQTSTAVQGTAATAPCPFVASPPASPSATSVN